MEDNIFAKIGRGEVPVELIYEDEQVVAFKDINPQAPVHALVIHYESFFHPVLDGSEPAPVLLLDTLGGGPAEEFLDSVARSVEASPCGPPLAAEGLRAEAFTVPFPGAWLLFDTALSNPKCR